MADDWMEDFEPAAATDTAKPDRRLIEDGTYDFEIVDTINEPAVLTVRLALDDKSFSWVFCNIQKTARFGKKLAHELREVLGIPRGGLMDAVAAGSLKGRRVKARVYQRQVGTKTFVNVGEFMAGDPAAQEPAKLATKRSKPVEFPDDDIPF